MPDAHEKEQAQAWVAAEITRLRNVSYAELAAREGEALHLDVFDERGKTWILETQFFWDDRERQHIRVVVDVWDPSRRISFGMGADAFIVAPDGSFVGE